MRFKSQQPVHLDSVRAKEKYRTQPYALFEVVPGMIHFFYSSSMSLREHLSRTLLKILHLASQ